ncbi:MAG TPA: substrate-binding domain-containing protein [Ktedonobacteraceae bacterium]|jgi:D-xylose transport system substrate-binding protein|nr:substrate-binding domain-containing protein [Ktedonobacteraceae bacterium]
MSSYIHQRYWMRFILTGSLVLFAFLLAACDTGTGTTAGPYAANGGKGCTKVGILLPETNSSTRWENKDHPLLVQAVSAAIPGVHIDYNNAQGNSTLQLQQAETDLANGDCILIVGAHDSVAAAAIVAKAKAQNVPVIAYDRLIQSRDLNYYVSFDNVKVGQLQGQYIAEHYLDYTTRGRPVKIMMINGSQTDNNALLFSEGAHMALDPLFSSGALNNIYETFTANWDNNIAQSEAETTLANQNNDIQIAYVANDAMAGGVINALKVANLAGKVLVTGQDATAAGINAILLGYQSMTVYKPIAQEARSTGALVHAIYEGTDTKLLTHGATTSSYDGGLIPSILDQPVMVDATNIKSTVIADGFLTRNEVCQGVPPGADGVC